ncbi:restriction endonuclease subunit S [Aeribacillus sp. FSL M8-0254]|uniref:restriction endonuclease subunit S n=1 Tax=Aeribacillus sp. FSL M8-0254 TaxID=2954577 RepID=UPI0030FAFDEF
MTFNGWKEVVLEEVSYYGDEKIPSAEVTLDNYISTENMLPNKSGVGMASGLPTTKSVRRYKKGDILLSNIRPYFKKIWFATKNGGCSNDVLVIKNKDEKELDKKYLYYTLLQDNFFDYVTATSKGTKMPRGDKSAIMNYGIMLPPLNEQKAIASILSAFDEKIETNNQINEKLEEMAQALFKHWFVDFEFPNENGKPYKSSGGEMVESELGMIPKGWEVKTINDISSEIITGKTPSTKEKENFGGNIPFVKIPDMHGKVYVEKTETYLSEKGAVKNKIVPKNSIMVSCIATPGIVSLAGQSCQTNQQINTIINKDNKMCYFNFFSLRNLSDTIRTLGSSGSATLNLNKNQFSKIKIVVPPKEMTDKYFNVVDKIFETIYLNQKENLKLIELRDTLLPKLMSGEIRVPLDIETLAEQS